MNLLKSNFSPILTVASANKSVVKALASSTSFGSFFKMICATLSTNSRKASPLATKSVSQLTSKTTVLPHFGQTTANAKPSAAIRSAFLAAFAKPFSRSQSAALSKSQSLASKAPLQSIKPAPVRSRNTLIKSIKESAILFVLFFFLFFFRSFEFCLFFSNSASFIVRCLS